MERSKRGHQRGEQWSPRRTMVLQLEGMEETERNQEESSSSEL